MNKIYENLFSEKWKHARNRSLLIGHEFTKNYCLDETS